MNCSSNPTPTITDKNQAILQSAVTRNPILIRPQNAMLETTVRRTETRKAPGHNHAAPPIAADLLRYYTSQVTREEATAWNVNLQVSLNAEIKQVRDGTAPE
ncbi:hypothetical protein M758_4G226500 [Ceratodon purpureus]|nr:hypothetical protein M758_4G226500 [Ceratodon purpureus]